MASPAFPNMESNNAPLPIPGGYGNATGVNPGGFKLTSGNSPTPLGPTAFPSFPAFGPSTAGVQGVKANVVSGGIANPAGAPTTPAANQGAFTGTNIQGLSSGLYSSLNGKPGNPGDALFKQLTKAFGTGAGTALFNQLVGGTFNPQVAAAFLNAMQPGISRGEADIQGAFGDAGSRFSSSAALGLGDYLSQVNLNEQSTLASLYQQGQQNELNLFENILPTLHAEQANSGGILGDILGGLEVIGGVAAAPFTGGLSLGLVGSGIGTIVGANSSGGGSGSGGGNSQQGIGALLQQMYKQIQAKNASTTIGAGGSSTSGAGVGQSGGGIGSGTDIPTMQSISAGGAFGGNDPFSSGGDSGAFGSVSSTDLNALLEMIKNDPGLQGVF